MSGAFGICIVGLMVGMVYYLYVVFVNHRTLESVLGTTIPFYKILGGIGIVGFILFLAFLISLISKGSSEKPR
jgi:hypothetical protein